MLQHQALERASLAPVLEHLLKVVPSEAPAAEERPLGVRVALVVEVARWTLALERRNVDLHLMEAAHVLFLRLETRLHRRHPALQGPADDVGDVTALAAELLGDGGIEAALDVADVELVRETVRHRAMQSL